MSAPTVVLHRPPLPRIDTGLKPRPIEPEDFGAVSDGTIALRQLGARIEQERIWGLIRQSAEGVNQAGSTEG